MMAIYLTVGTAGATLDQLNLPVGIFYDSVKNGIYVADTDNSRVMYFRVGNRNGTIVAGNNTAGVTPTQLKFPHGVYFDSISNSTIIANSGGANILRWSIGASNWTLVAGGSGVVAGTAPNRFNYPLGVILDPMNNLYVADYGNHRVQFFLSGEMNGRTIAGFTGVNGNNASSLDSPGSVALDSQLNLYVNDVSNHRVQKFLRY